MNELSRFNKKEPIIIECVYSVKENKAHRNKPNLTDYVRAFCTSNLYGYWTSSGLENILSEYIKHAVEVEPMGEVVSKSYFKFGKYILELDNRYRYIAVKNNGSLLGYVSKPYYQLLLSYIAFNVGMIDKLAR